MRKKWASDKGENQTKSWISAMCMIKWCGLMRLIKESKKRARLRTWDWWRDWLTHIVCYVRRCAYSGVYLIFFTSYCQPATHLALSSSCNTSYCVASSCKKQSLLGRAWELEGRRDTDMIQLGVRARSFLMRQGRGSEATEAVFCI